MILVDLHLHSTFSDGSLAPELLVARGRSKGLFVMSLTDHDTAAGLPGFMTACSRWNMQCVTGIELSADFRRTMHILGYRINYRDPAFESVLESLRKGREWRNGEMVRRLQKMGLDISMEEVAAEAGGDVVARPHLAKVMVRKGYVNDLPSAFARYIGDSGPAYVERDRLSPRECISLIRNAGGLAVLAHPVQTADTIGELREISAGLKEWGLWGMECISSRHTSEQIFQYLSVAAEFGLFPTAGSDFHGSANPSTAMGIPVSEDFLPWARLGVTL